MVKNKNILTLFAIAILGIVIFYALNSDVPQGGVARSPQAEEVVTIFFTTSVDLAPGGNFKFQYPSALLIKENSGARSTDETLHHFVILVAKESSFAADTIEINIPDKTCADYVVCKEVIGAITGETVSFNTGNAVVGTNSDDHEFLKFFDVVVETFEILPPRSVQGIIELPPPQN